MTDMTLDQITKVRREYHLGLLPSSAIAWFEEIPGWQWGEPGAPIEYSVALAETGECPKVSDWVENTALRHGNFLTCAKGPRITIKFGYGLPDVKLRAEQGSAGNFGLVEIANAICRAFPAARFVHDNRLESIAVHQDGKTITFRLGR